MWPRRSSLARPLQPLRQSDRGGGGHRKLANHELDHTEHNEHIDRIMTKLLKEFDELSFSANIRKNTCQSSFPTKALEEKIQMAQAWRRLNNDCRNGSRNSLAKRIQSDF